MHKSTADINLREDIIICGHRNPDTDSVCSAYGLQRYKEALGQESRHIAVRCGRLNPQTKYIFSHLGIEPPPLLPDINYRVHNIMSPVCLSSPYASISQAAQVMKEQSLRLVPVQNEQDQYQGVYTLDEMTNFLIERTRSTYTNYEIVLENLINILDAQVVMRGKQTIVNAGFLVGSMDRDQIAEYFNNLDLTRFFLVIGRRRRIISAAMAQGIAGVIITGDSLSDEEIRELDPSYQGWVLRSSQHSENVTRASAMASSVRTHLSREVRTITPDGLLEEAKQILEYQPGLPVVDNEGRLYGMVRRSDVINIRKPRLILTDHNEPTQSILGSEHAEIIQIIDHHRLSPRPTSKPINFLTAPVGSTCTLVSELFLELSKTLPMDAAKILLSGVISDTVMLRSPTTTDRDREVVTRLAKITGIDPMQLGTDIYTNGSMLKGMPIDKIIKNDFKEFEHNGIKLGVGQIEVVSICEIDDMRDGLLAGLDNLTLAKGGSYHWTVLLVTNIHTCDSILLSSDYARGQAKLGYEKSEKQIYDLPGVMSRKKQLLPALLEALTD
ncbi:putative manganese-dependent inorganic diphosphatase [Candidatus Haliotispira prima]|uniref:inorganic diphosphatase n=1 Tax=Candidatus Haliotispira prima TaxID=3034016 RepID=A0ABY8MFQ7_9SPIO|nr:putative manganese-dependent inorganic diphosphatase [Candidatus Haliotispira prima]